MSGKSRITGTASNTAKTPGEETSRVRINLRDTVRETPLDNPVGERTNAQKIADLRTFLAANVAVRTADGELEKAAIFQQHLDIFDLTVAYSQDRI